MSSMANEHLEQFCSSLEDWVDERFISKLELRDVAMFTMYLVNLGEHDGWELRGHSHKRGVPLGTLVVKVVLHEKPLVCFISGRTLVNCIRIFLRRLEEDTVEWRDDKYA